MSVRDLLFGTLAAVVGVIAFLNVQIVAGWPLSARATGPVLFAATIVSAVGLAFIAGLMVSGPDTPQRSLRDLLIAGMLVAAAGLGLWLGAREGLVAFAAGYAVVAASYAGSKRLLVPAVLAAGALLIAAWRGPF